MQGDRPYRELVAALWATLRCGAAHVPDSDLLQAAAGAAAALRRLAAREPHLVLQERTGALFANGVCLRPDVDSFSTISGIVELMRGHRIGEVLLLARADADSFVTAARVLATGADDLEAALRAAGCEGVHVAQSGDAGAAEAGPWPGADPAAQSFSARETDGGRERVPFHGGANGGAVATSHLSAVFTMQRFCAAVDHEGPLGGARARAILQDALEALLSHPDGLAPLLSLEPHGEELVHVVRATVLAVRVAECLGWESERCLLAGVLALRGEGAAIDDDDAGELGRVARRVADCTAWQGVLSGASLVGDGEPLPDRFATAIAEILAEAF